LSIETAGTTWPEATRPKQQPLAEQQTTLEERERVVKPASPELQKRIEEARKRALTPQM
jgi:hypothetical protein